MAGLSFSPELRRQFAAIARLRWQLFFNSLRTIRGRLELVGRVYIGIMAFFVAFGGAFGLGVGAWFFVNDGRAEWIALLLWPVFFFWQMFPVAASTFTQVMDWSELLRFPLSYRAYFLIRVAYSSFDPITFIAALWLVGIGLGAGVARLSLLPWALLVLALFAVLNILLQLAVFTWIERWLARRRTREILSVLFFLMIMGVNFIGPIMQHYGRRSAAGIERVVPALGNIQRVLPPGVAAATVAGAAHGQFLESLGWFTLLCVYGSVTFYLLHSRMRAQFRGENLNEVTAQRVSREEAGKLRLGWKVFGLAGPVAAIVEKEIRYLVRSIPILFTLVVPLIMLIVFRSGAMRAGRGGGGFFHASDFIFPLATAYALMVMTNLIYNSFGGDGAGVQVLFVLPANFGTIMRAKNLAHLFIFMLEILLVWLAVLLLYRTPSLLVTVLTLTWCLFALPLDFAVANLASIYFPKKIDFGKFGRQQTSRVTGLLSLAMRAVVVGPAAIVVFIAQSLGNLWIAAPIFLALGAASFGLYVFVLTRVDGIAMKRREQLVAELARA
jgi:ABC-2 type transport system permease protein